MRYWRLMGREGRHPLKFNSVSWRSSRNDYYKKKKGEAIQWNMKKWLIPFVGCPWEDRYCVFGKWNNQLKEEENKKE